MEAVTTKKRRALSDVSNKANNAVTKKKCLAALSKITKPVATRKSSRTIKKTAVDNLVPPIERLVFNQDVVAKEDIALNEEQVTETQQEVVEALNWVNVDSDTTCTYFIPEYVTDIFQYYKDREPLFKVGDYMSTGSNDVSLDMRAVLVDWLVDVQQSFELNHENLYSAVKMFDLYLSKSHVSKSKIQLVGAVALNISCKYDERIPPILDDFVYVCDDAYNREEFIDMEKNMLRTLNFDIGYPLSYTFLRRFSQCARTTTAILTLARFFLEMSLMFYEFVKENESLMASAALYMAMTLKEEGSWDDTLIHYTGYRAVQLYDIIISLNDKLTSSSIMDTKSIKAKYSHRVFFEVSKTPLPSSEELSQLLLRRSH